MHNSWLSAFAPLNLLGTFPHVICELVIAAWCYASAPQYRHSKQQVSHECLWYSETDSDTQVSILSLFSRLVPVCSPSDETNTRGHIKKENLWSLLISHLAGTPLSAPTQPHRETPWSKIEVGAEHHCCHNKGRVNNKIYHKFPFPFSHFYWDNLLYH